MSSRAASRRVDLAVLAGLLCVSAALLYIVRPHGLDLSDEGFMVYPAARMLEGELLYRDVYHYYAPLPYHVLEAVFRLTGPSLLAARSLWMLFLLASIACTYRVARRFAPPSTAWIPAATYALVPGPWHKAFYGLCTVAFLLVLARALEHKSARRYLALGAVCGLTLMSRQELGVGQLLLSVGIVGGMPLWPLASETPLRARLTLGLRRGSFVVAGFLAVLSPLIGLYAARGNLASMLEAVFVQAYQYSSRSSSSFLAILPFGDFPEPVEGRAVATVMLVALFLIPLAAALALRSLRLRGLDAHVALAAALLALLLPAVVQSYNPPLLARFLQSAICFYLLVPFVLGEASEKMRPMLTALSALGFALYVAFVIAAPIHVHPSQAYTGSLRSLRLTSPVSTQGGELFTDEERASEIRLVQAFIAERTQPGEPIFTAPLLSTYYLLLDRPNATAFLGDFPFADLAMSRERKRSEMQRLVDSEVRYAVVAREWWEKRGGERRPVLTGLLSAFAPVRFYGEVVVLERSGDSARLALHEIAARIRAQGPRPGDVKALRSLRQARPDDPVVHELLAELLLKEKKVALATASLEAALRHDPKNPRLRARLGGLVPGPGMVR